MNKLTIIAGAVVILAVLAGVFALAWHGDIAGSAALVVAASALSSVAGAVGVHAGAQLGLASATPTPLPLPALSSTVETTPPTPTS